MWSGRAQQVLALVWLALLVPAEVISQSNGREAELEAIRDEIAQLQSRLNRVRQQRAGVRGELDQTEVAIDLQLQRVAEARTARELAEEASKDLEQEVAALEQRLVDLRHRLRERVVDLYRLGRQGYLRLILSIRAEEDLLAGIRQVRFLALRDQDLLDEYLDTRVRLEFEREQLAIRQQEVETWLAAETTRLDQLNRLRRRQATLLAKLESEQRSLTAEAMRLEDKERKLTNLLEFLYGRNTQPLAGTPIQDFQGALDWPVPGQVVLGFGPRRDPRYKTQVPHNGLEIATNDGTSVKAIFPGSVLFAAPLQGYGWTVVLHHPGRVFSLYAGLRELKVGEGDMLSLGRVLGVSDESLYFEIRVENRPVNPEEWLR